MKISSPAFAEGQSIPLRYTMYGANLTPPLRITDVPPGARSLALIVDDPDATRGTFTHWLLFNLDPRTTSLEEDTVPGGAVQGRNDYGKTGYGGPRPPSGTHRYFFRLSALDVMLELSKGAERQELERQMRGHVIGEAVLMGTFAHDSALRATSGA